MAHSRYPHSTGPVLATLSLLRHIPLFWNGHHPYLGTVHVETARVPRCPAAAGLAPLLARLRSGPHHEPQSQVILHSPSGPELTPVRRGALSLKSQALGLAEKLPPHKKAGPLTECRPRSPLADAELLVSGNPWPPLSIPGLP